MTTIATPPAAALDAVLDRVRAGKTLIDAEADLLSAGVTSLRRTAGGLQRRSQQQAARIAEMEADGQAVLKREAIARTAAAARAEFAAERGATSSPAEEIAYHAFGLGARLDAAEATIARVRLYADLLALADMTADAREVARIVLDVLDGKEPTEASPPAAHPQHLRDRLAAAIRTATCPGECDGREYCEHGRFQPTVWDDNEQPVEVGISGPPERI
ncbi:hypothetical protein AB0N46_31810, partial [Streptomyces albidoflavus]|uniref:hypothetical protein n=1 Tax=Streptomyces albidoflavus TaxID=1886 RepID=UPI003433DF97